jgi:hypothetical protein
MRLKEEALEMMKTIAQNDSYVIAVDPSKNRAYLTLIGYWKSRAEVPKYIDDWKKAIKELSKGFTVLSDVTRMKAPPQDVVQLHTEAQKVLMAGGLSKVAELVGSDVIAKMAIDRFSRESGMYKGTFDNWREADDWLDKKETR